MPPKILAEMVLIAYFSYLQLWLKERNSLR